MYLGNRDHVLVILVPCNTTFWTTCAVSGHLLLTERHSQAVLCIALHAEMNRHGNHHQGVSRLLKLDNVLVMYSQIGRCS